MEEFLGSLISFMVEKAIINSIPMFLASGIVAYVAGPFLSSSGVGKYWRTGIYSVVGVIAGLWSYATFDAPDRAVEAWEIATVGFAMLVYAICVIGVFVLIKHSSKT